MRVLLGFLFLVLILGVGCGKKRLLSENPDRQKFRDLTQKYFDQPLSGIHQARFGLINRDILPDLLLLRKDSKDIPFLQVWVNRESQKFKMVKRLGWKGNAADRVFHLALGDLDHDRASDVVLVGKFQGGASAQLLFNNGKGYFYRRHQVVLPPLPSGLERVDMVDIDQDGHADLLFTGRNVSGMDEEESPHPIRILLNDGSGRFQDTTRLLMPQIPQGIIGTSFADYNGDAVVDVFLVYAQGPNRLLINNGHGQFTDRTQDLLPPLKGESLFADWADFDQDGDNDLLVVNESIHSEDREFDNEYCYMLVNNGNGFFRKGPLKVLPRSPSRAVYLLDANGNGIPDILILSRRGIHFLRGKGKWQFWKESRRRLPRNVHFRELDFADVDDDGHLDIFGVSIKGGQGSLWVNGFR